ncbi:hypothetical protein FSP39_003641 [Pinctada imbricata]|uniref:C3H1-type domain-containing protein n=1 Tax=Pinctada imbricata TaxID=66713 RepID=A0AA89BVL8_PINIB|nr:hypothetical protein FSP39_003641 [Pinctada imbricata]
MLRSSARRSTSQYARGRSRGTLKAPAATMKARSATKRRTSTVVTRCPPETDVNSTPPESRATLPASSPEEAPTIIQDNDVIDAMPLSPPPQSTITAAHDALADATSKGTCTLNDGVSNYAFPIQPNALVSVTDALGAHVASSLKSSIFNNEFVHLHKLIPNKANEEPQQQLTLVNGELVIKPKHKEVRINSLDSWTNAFLIYMSIYLSKFPEHAQSLLKYLHTVRTAAQRSTNLSWLDYDVQFRLKRSRNHTIQWDSVDAELWLLYVNPSSTSITNTTPAKAGKCFDFNYKGLCSKPICNYQHLCMKCSKSHPMMNCRVQTSNRQDPKTFRQEYKHTPTTQYAGHQYAGHQYAGHQYAAPQAASKGYGRGQSNMNSKALGYGSYPY